LRLQAFAAHGCARGVGCGTQRVWVRDAAAERLQAEVAGKADGHGASAWRAEREEERARVGVLKTLACPFTFLRRTSSRIHATCM
jgi:hypothetical protein